MSGNEGIHGGADATMFWASDGEVVYTAIRATIFHCGKCGVNLGKDEWVCNHCHARNKL